MKCTSMSVALFKDTSQSRDGDFNEKKFIGKLIKLCGVETAK